MHNCEAGVRALHEAQGCRDAVQDVAHFSGLRRGQATQPWRLNVPTAFAPTRQLVTRCCCPLLLRMHEHAPPRTTSHCCCGVLLTAAACRWRTLASVTDSCLKHDSEHGAQSEVDQRQPLLLRASDDGTNRTGKLIACRTCGTPHAM